jgi:hypothetical protein
MGQRVIFFYAIVVVLTCCSFVLKQPAAADTALQVNFFQVLRPFLSLACGWDSERYPPYTPYGTVIEIHDNAHDIFFFYCFEVEVSVSSFGGPVSHPPSRPSPPTYRSMSSYHGYVY